MAKRRLTQLMRGRLNSHADETVAPRTEKEALGAAYKLAEPLVRKCVAEKFPPRDMKICQKYGAASIDDCIKLQFPNGVVDVFRFTEGTGPVVAAKTYQGQIYLADQDTAAAVEAWLAADEAFKTERKKRLTAYRALLDGARYVEEVVEIWPEAASIVPPNGSLIPLGPEQIAIVQSDVLERSAA